MIMLPIEHESGIGFAVIEPRVAKHCFRDVRHCALYGQALPGCFVKTSVYPVNSAVNPPGVCCRVVENRDIHGEGFPRPQQESVLSQFKAGFLVMGVHRSMSHPKPAYWSNSPATPGCQASRPSFPRTVYGEAHSPVTRLPVKANATGWDKRSLRVIHQGEAGNSVGACRSRGVLLSEARGASPRLVPYMNPGRKNRGAFDTKGRLSLITPFHGDVPALQTVNV